jgi:hypothetical protein
MWRPGDILLEYRSVSDVTIERIYLMCEHSLQNNRQLLSPSYIVNLCVCFGVTRACVKKSHLTTFCKCGFFNRKKAWVL